LSGPNPFGPGLNPFNGPEQTLQFADIARQVRQSGFTVAQLNYLCRHVVDPRSNLAPRRDSLLLLAKTLREGLTRIEEEYAIPKDPGGNVLSEDPLGELTRARLSWIFASTSVAQAVRMIDGSALYAVPLDSLPAAIAAKNSAGTVVGIDPNKIPPS